jgi:hypothetical protein
MCTGSLREAEQFSDILPAYGLNITTDERKAIERFGDHFECDHQDRRKFFAAGRVGDDELLYEECLSAINVSRGVMGLVA